MGLGIGTFRLYSNEIYLFLGAILTLLFIQEVALIGLLKSSYREVIIRRKIKASDNETMQKMTYEMYNGKTWEKQNFFAKLFSMYPFQGLFYSWEFIISVLIVLVIIESVTMPGIIAVYLIIITIPKLIYFFSFIWKIKKTMFMTKVMKGLQK